MVVILFKTVFLESSTQLEWLQNLLNVYGVGTQRTPSFFFSPHKHLCAVTYITEILKVTLSNQSILFNPNGIKTISYMMSGGHHCFVIYTRASPFLTQKLRLVHRRYTVATFLDCPIKRVVTNMIPRGDAGGLSREYVLRIPSVS